MHRISIGFNVTSQGSGNVEITLKDIEFLESSLPILNITVEDKEDDNGQNEGTVSLTVTEGFEGGYSSKQQKDLKDVKLDSVSAEDGSYGIKFAKDISLFGMGMSKNWVLLSNSSDCTYVKERFTSWLSGKLGMEYTRQMVPVELVVGNEYRGLYYLCELIEVADGRIEIERLKADIKDDRISGGYLLSMCDAEYRDSDNLFFTAHGARFVTKNPAFGADYYCTEQRDYIRDYFSKIEEAVYGEGFTEHK